MRLVVEEERDQWRWICDCGSAGHWQDLSFANSHNAAMSHYEREHCQNHIQQPPIPWFQSA